jgi:hypothetical protein
MTYRAVPPRSGPWWFSGWVALWSTSVDPESLAFRRRRSITPDVPINADAV